MILSKSMMKQWSMDLRFGKGEIYIGKFSATVPFLKDVPIVDIFDVDVQTIIDQWENIPRHFKLLDKPPNKEVSRQTKFWKDGKCHIVRKEGNKAPTAVKVNTVQIDDNPQIISLDENLNA